MQERAWTLARQHSRADTDVILLLNRDESLSKSPPDDVDIIHRFPAFDDEQDLWQFGLDLAIRRGWDWTMFIHDDFAILEPGWEADIELSADWRVALASWCVYTDWDEPGGSYPTTHHLGVTVDSMSFGFRTDVFAARGCVTAQRYGFGFGAWDSCAWALDNGYGVWRVQLDSDHQWEPTNSRVLLRQGAGGHQHVTALWKDRILPARTPDWAHVQAGSRTFRIAPASLQTPPVIRDVITTGINPGNVFKTEYGVSSHYRNGQNLGPFRV